MSRKRKKPLRIDLELGPIWECTSCHIGKAIGEFYKSRGTSNGLTPRCKVCMDLTNAEYREKNASENETEGKYSEYLLTLNGQLEEKIKEQRERIEKLQTYVKNLERQLET